MSMRMLAAVLVSAIPWAAAAQTPVVSVVLKPLERGGEISRVEVRQSVSGFAAEAGQTADDGAEGGLPVGDEHDDDHGHGDHEEGHH